uniref:Histone-lysine N-methyltransferase SUVR3 n=1 Tax=Kalanchoe fedtschenkoi TaxID=63787 RepID=A0A7N0UWN1_KALFE
MSGDQMPARRPAKLPRIHDDDSGASHTRNSSQASVDAPIIRCAHLFLPFLETAELAVVAYTCKPLNSIARAVTSLRSSDASRGFEKHCIPFVNTVDDQPYSYFLYTPSQLYNSDAFHRQAWGLPEPSFGVGLGRIGEEGVSFEFGSGCDCESCGEECPCDLGFEDFGVVNECGRGCGCGMECGNRVSQRGINLRLKIVKDGRKGWGLYAAEFIQCGQFVCEYAGKFINLGLDHLIHFCFWSLIHLVLNGIVL